MMAREIIVTVPQSLNRALLMRQLMGCNGRVAWHLCVNRLPKELPARMHFVHCGEVIGSLPVLDMGPWCGRPLRRADGTPLSTEGRKFAIRANGTFKYQRPAIRKRGFQGWRYFDAEAASKCTTCGGLEAVPDGNGDFTPCPDCSVRVLMEKQMHSKVATQLEKVKSVMQVAGDRLEPEQFIELMEEVRDEADGRAMAMREELREKAKAGD